MAYIETSRGTPSVLAERGTNIVFVDANGNQLFTVAHPGYVAFSGALPAGTNNIGKVDINSLPVLPAGDNNIGKVDIASMPSVTIAGGYKEHRLLSSDEKPMTDNSKGDAVLEIDTGDVYIWNGTSWGAF